MVSMAAGGVKEAEYEFRVVEGAKRLARMPMRARVGSMIVNQMR